jgi:hypothetical protein
MTAHPQPQDQIIEAYVLDIIRRLPGRMRHDVGFELRALLTESLRDRAAAAGRLPDEAMALEIVREFGMPETVAERYHPSGAPIIPAQQTRWFVWATIIGLVLQWATSLPLVLSGQLLHDNPGAVRFTAWWLSYGLGAFWWPGFLVSMMMIAAWVRRIWPTKAADWKPASSVDPDRINRTAYLIGLGLALCGIAAWVLVVWAVTTFDTPATHALAFAPDFLATRAPVVLLFWAAGVALMVVLVLEGRWRRLTRRIDTGSKLAACALMLWLVLGGRIFFSDAADGTTKNLLLVLVLLIAGQLAFRAWRARPRIRTPDVQRG